MRYFTESLFERMMMQTPKSGREEPPPPLPKDHRCYGCSYYGSCCAGTCYRSLIATPKVKNLER